MPRLTLTLAATLAAVLAGAAHTQADNTNSRIVPNQALTTDIYEANKDGYPWGNGYYDDADPGYAYERREYRLPAGPQIGPRQYSKP